MAGLNGDREYREDAARMLACKLGVDADALVAGAQAAWSAMNPDRATYQQALSVAGAVLFAAQKSGS